MMSYELGPVAAMSVLEHFRRTGEQHKGFVFGALLGSCTSTTVTISDAVGIPYDDSQQLDVEHFHRMYALLSKVTEDKLVGWFATVYFHDDKPANPSLLKFLARLDQFFSSQVAEDVTPLFLTVDTKMTGDTLSWKGYNGSIHSQGVTIETFVPVPVTLTALPDELTVLDALLLSKPDDETVFNSPAQLISDLERMDVHMLDLEDLLSRVIDYAEAAAESGEGDARVGTALAGLVARLPALEGYKSQLEGDIAERVQDLDMITHLAGILKTQVSLSDKINAMT